MVKSLIFICKNKKKKAGERHSANEGGKGTYRTKYCPHSQLPACFQRWTTQAMSGVSNSVGLLLIVVDIWLNKQPTNKTSHNLTSTFFSELRLNTPSLCFSFIVYARIRERRPSKPPSFFSEAKPRGDLSPFLTGNFCRNQILFLLRSAGVERGKKTTQMPFQLSPPMTKKSRGEKKLKTSIAKVQSYCKKAKAVAGTSSSSLKCKSSSENWP